MTRAALVLGALALAGCALSHTRGDPAPSDAGPSDPGPPDAGPPDAGPPDAGPRDAGAPAVPAALADDWTFRSPICDSVNRVVWLTVCGDGRAWLSDATEHSGGWQTYTRQAVAIDERSFEVRTVEASGPRARFELETDEDALIWRDLVDAEPGCGVLESRGRRGPPDGFYPEPLPDHACR